MTPHDPPPEDANPGDYCVHGVSWRDDCIDCQEECNHRFRWCSGAYLCPKCGMHGDPRND